jgi:hypothetical protein
VVSSRDRRDRGGGWIHHIDHGRAPLGTRLILDVAGLPPAEPGEYHEAWMRTGPEVGVSAGTFHLRGDHGQIELWAGVTADNYPLSLSPGRTMPTR